MFLGLAGEVELALLHAIEERRELRTGSRQDHGLVRALHEMDVVASAATMVGDWAQSDDRLIGASQDDGARQNRVVGARQILHDRAVTGLATPLHRVREV